MPDPLPDPLPDWMPDWMPDPAPAVRQGWRRGMLPAGIGRLGRVSLGRISRLLGPLLVLHLVAPAGWPTELSYTVAAGSAAMLVHDGIRRHRPVRTMGWRLLEAALWLLAAYGPALAMQRLLPAAQWPAGLAVAIDLGVNLATLGAAFHVLAVRRPGQDRTALIDTTTVVLAGGLLFWQLSVRGDALARAIQLRMAPLTAVLLMAAVLVVGLRLYVVEHRPRSYLPLLAGVVVALTGDAATAMASTMTAPPRVVQSLWLLSAALVAAAAQLPDMRCLAEPETSLDLHVSPWRLVVLGAALLTSPALVVLAGYPPTPRDWLLAGGLTALTLLVLWRIGRLLLERESMRAELAREAGEREELQARLVHQATHDVLTGLPNRRLFYQRVHSALGGSSCQLALLSVDLDDFKAVNDTLGHAAGDELLAVVGARLGSCLRAEDIAGRVGGDEFAVLVDLATDGHAAVAIAERLLSTLSQPVALGGTMVRVGASVGIAYCRDGGCGTAVCIRDADVLLEYADKSMYEAKRSGKGQYRAWPPPPPGPPGPPAAHGEAASGSLNAAPALVISEASPAPCTGTGACC